MNPYPTLLVLLCALAGAAAVGFALRSAGLAAALARAREAERRLRQIVEHSGELSWAIDGDAGAPAYVSPAAQQLGYDDGALRKLVGELATALPARLQGLAAGDA